MILEIVVLAFFFIVLFIIGWGELMAWLGKTPSSSDEEDPKFEYPLEIISSKLINSKEDLEAELEAIEKGNKEEA